MGRVKLEIKRIENNTNRQVTFCARNGLIKKATNFPSFATLISPLSCSLPPVAVLAIFPAKRIEDVFSRYVNLPDQEREHAIVFPDQNRHPDIQNKEYLLRTLQQLRSENDIALQLANPAAINNDIEDLQQEVGRLQQQLQIAEEQIRTYEPDPLRITSIGELESYEKNLVDTLTRVVQRKEFLLSNHLSSYDTSTIQQTMPTSFENEVVGWLPDGGGQNQAQIFDTPASLNQLRDLSTTMYEPLLQGTSSNTDPHNIAECHVSNTSGENFATWQQAYASTGLHSAPIPPSLYPQIQNHGMMGADTADILQSEQVDIPINGSHQLPVENEGATYENKIPQMNGQ